MTWRRTVSFGEKWPEREPFGFSGAETGQQILREMAADVGLCRRPRQRERQFAHLAVAEGKSLKSNGLLRGRGAAGLLPITASASLKSACAWTGSRRSGTNIAR